MAMNTQRPQLVETQALWAVAYLLDRIPSLRSSGGSPPAVSEKEIMEETALVSRFFRWRYPYGHGRRFVDMVFETLPYCDVLLKDLGMQTRRKKGWFSWLREWIEPYGRDEYKGLTEEWMQKEKGIEKKEH
jgi:hypothetical protein